MIDTHAMSPNRRRFIFLTSVVGLSAVVSPLVVPKLLRRMGYERNLYEGALVDRIDELVRRLGRSEITQEQFVIEVRSRYQDIDLRSEFAAWLGELPREPGSVTLFQKRSTPHRQLLKILYIPPNTSHPPHAHHNLLSAQCVLMGDLNVRQYERVKRIDDRTVSLRPATDVLMKPYDYILTSEHMTNVHWFGANDQPTAVLNFNAIDGLQDTFEPAQHAVGRYYLDPTVSQRDGDLILAPHMDSESAEARFAHRCLRDFPGAEMKAAARS